MKKNKAFAVTGVFISIIYLLNLTFGVLEIPDYLPIVGNIDEVMASALLFSSLRNLGYDILLYKTHLNE
jgi:hypothetical protein